MQEPHQRADLSELARAAKRGDPRAWDRLVSELTPLLRGAIRRYGLSHHDAEDVIQCTWIRAWAGIGGLHEPAAIAGWLLTSVRRNALRALHSHARETPTGELAADLPEPGPSLDERLLERERATALHGAIRRLPTRQRMMLEALMRDRDGGYQRIADELGVPIGSIGPTRARSFARLRDDAALSLVTSL
jgi:RNA polymerase sigma factor (sigma-70 family)